MTVEFAIAYIPMRMRELGFADQYMIRWRHLFLDASELRSIQASNELYLLIQPSATITVRSKFGMYDQALQNITELQYEHRGRIDIRNNTSAPQWVLFIQVIPRHRPKQE